MQGSKICSNFLYESINHREERNHIGMSLGIGLRAFYTTLLGCYWEILGRALLSVFELSALPVSHIGIALIGCLRVKGGRRWIYATTLCICSCVVGVVYLG